MKLLYAIKSGNEVQALSLVQTSDLETLNSLKELGDVGLLHFAIDRRQSKVAAALIEKGVDPEARDVNGNTPLHYAAAVGDIDIITKLDKAGANINAQNTQGMTPVISAIGNGKTQAAKAIINKFNTDVNLADNDGKTPLHHAAERGNDLLLPALIANRVDIEAKDKSGKTALDVARGDAKDSLHAISLFARIADEQKAQSSVSSQPVATSAKSHKTSRGSGIE
jgi:ankyrin repeat protein